MYSEQVRLNWQRTKLYDAFVTQTYACMTIDEKPSGFVSCLNVASNGLANIVSWRSTGVL